jgi:GntR family phosphonate transport system transcriptional regulator
VRRALAALADNGLTHARRGAGVFVTHMSTDYPLGRRVRFHQNVLATGRTPRRKMLLLETRLADAAEAEALAIAPSAQVQVCEGLSLVDDSPIAVFRSVFPTARFPNMLDHLQKNGSVTAGLNAAGVDDYVRSYTRMNAKLASATMAALLEVKPGEPIMRTTSVNVDGAGTPVEFGRTWFAGDRVTLTLGGED